jgi:ABC-type antimicrobial peptide transport system permease subunit
VIYQMPLPVEVPLVARASGSPAAIVSAFRRAVTETDARSILQTVLIGDDYLDAALAPARFAMALLGAFSVVALILSAVGLYGVIAYSVSQRTREIGVRVALGANSASIGRLVVGDGFRLAAAGVVVGVIASIAATRALVSMLYGVGPLDPVTFGAIGLLVAGIALLASYVPARRASRIDPMEALRVE